MHLKYDKSKEALNLQVVTEKVHYAMVHKRALKVEVCLSVSEI